jgi:hypothetical protein
VAIFLILRKILYLCGGIFIILLFIWYLIPMFLGFLSNYSWQGYQERISSLTKSGMTRENAIKQVMKNVNAQKQPNATAIGAFSIAAAILNRQK